MLDKKIIKLLKNRGIYFSQKQASVGKLAVLFPGHGSQYPNMLKNLIADFPHVKKIFEMSDSLLYELEHIKLTDSIFYSSPQEKEIVERKMKDPIIMQTSIYTCNYVLYSLLLEHVKEYSDFRVDYLCGHSLGEISALVAGDSISFSDGFHIVYYRAKALSAIDPNKRGGMIAISLDKDDLELNRILNRIDDYCVLAIQNAPKQSIVSGTESALNQIKKMCEEKGINSTILAASHAFHSNLLEGAVGYYKEKIASFNFKVPKIPIYSNIINRVYTQELFYDKKIPSILSSQLITPFYFQDNIMKLHKDLMVSKFLELGGKNILTNLIDKILLNEDVEIISFNSEKINDTLAFNMGIANMNASGIFYSQSRKGIYMGKNDLLEEEIKHIVYSYTGYPKEIIKITDNSFKEELAINNKVFEKIIDKFSEKYGISRQELSQNSQLSLRDIKLLCDGDINVETDDISDSHLFDPDLNKEQSISTNITRDIGIEEIIQEAKKIIENYTGYPVDLLEEDLELEADLGIDSVKQTEIFGKIREKYNYELPENFQVKELNTIGKIANYTFSRIEEQQTETENTPIMASRNSDSLETIIENIKVIISEYTGYPTDLLVQDLELEADLGIDSVKQAEVFGKIIERYNLESSESFRAKNVNTIEKIALYTQSCQITNQVERINVESSDTNNLISENEIMSEVQSIISTYTGYPLELIQPELELEADLGIDSVKQAEIFSKIREKYKYELPESFQIKEFNTLQKIVLFIKEQLVLSKENVYEMTKDIQKHKSVNNEGTLRELFKADYEHSDCKRFISIPIMCDYVYNPDWEFSFMNKKVIIIEDQIDGEITAKLVNRIHRIAGDICVLGKHKYENSFSLFTDFSDTSSIDDVMKKSISYFDNEVDIIINLYGLSNRGEMDSMSYKEWDQEVQAIYNTLFYSSKNAYPYLEAEPKERGYFAATNIGGIFGIEKNSIVNPLGAITTGFMKALEKELRPLNCKVIDFTDVDDKEQIAELLIQNFKLRENFVEIGYSRNYRKTIAVIPKELNDNVEISQLAISDKDVIFVSGGGRGIISKCVEELSMIINPTIIVTGRTMLPNGDEKWLHMSDDELENYKKEYMLEVIREQKVKTPLEAMEAFEKLVHAKDLYHEFNSKRNSGYKIYYMQCNIRDYEQVKYTIQKVVEKFGSITGIVNGAGLPSFGKVDSKPVMQSLEVVRVKADGLYNLYHTCDLKYLKFMVSMGSISGRFGMDGQVDYSAGADVIVKLSNKIKEKYPHIKCFVLGWTAWDEVGMASNAEVKRVQEERGLGYIDIKTGIGRFMDELIYGGIDTETLFFSTLGDSNMPLGQLDLLDEQFRSLKKTCDDKGYIYNRIEYPLIDQIKESKKAGFIEGSKVLDKELDIHLKNHLVEGTSVFAGVMHVETACELGTLLCNNEDFKQYKAVEINNFRFHKFIKLFDSRQLTLNIKGQLVLDKEDIKRISVKLYSDFINKYGIVLEKERLHSEGDIIFGMESKPMRKLDYDFEQLQRDSVEIDMNAYYREAAQNITFGESFKCIQYAGFVKKDELFGRVKIDWDTDSFSFIPLVETIISPITIDNAGRFMLLNEFQERGRTVVPTQIEKAVKYRDFIPGEIVYVRTVKVQEEGNEVTYSSEIMDQDHYLIFDIQNMTLTQVGGENESRNIIKSSKLD